MNDEKYINIDNFNIINSPLEYNESDNLELTNEEKRELHKNGIKLYQFQKNKIVEIGLFNTCSDILIQEFEYNNLNYKILSSLYNKDNLLDDINKLNKISILKILIYHNFACIGCFVYHLNINKKINDVLNDVYDGTFHISFVNDDENVILRTYPCDIDKDILLSEIIKCIKIPYIQTILQNKII